MLEKATLGNPVSVNCYVYLCLWKRFASINCFIPLKFATTLGN